MKLKILNTIGSRFDKQARDILDSLGDTRYLDINQKGLEQHISDYDVLLVGIGLYINKSVIDQANRLKIIATATTGLDHIDLDYTQVRGITVLSLRGENEFLNTITGTAELAFGLLLDLARNISISFNAVINGHWDRERFIGHNLIGKTLGIIGYGRLGRMVARYGKAFGMKIIVADPYVAEDLINADGHRKVSFTQLVQESDAISIHVHLDATTENMFDQAVFAQTKSTAYLVNTSRGKIVDEVALLQALKDKRIAGYATDVLADEVNFYQGFTRQPLVEYAKNNNNVIITPHVGGMTYESRAATDVFIVEKIKEFLARNKKMRNSTK